MKYKIFIPALVTAAAGMSVYLQPHNRYPSDFRDAVGSGSPLSQLRDSAPAEAAGPAAAVPPKGWFSGSNEPQAPKEWTVLVYMNGKNDLELSGLYNLNKMELAGSSAALNIVTETGRMNGQLDDTSADGNWTGSRRYYVTRDLDQKRVNSKAIQSFAKVDMGDWKHLVDFAKWGMNNYPAKHYALIVWNHGSGWLTTKSAQVSKGISYDFETKNHISTPELGAAMKEIGKVDILAYDACLMQMAELLYEVNGYADYVVGSEETIPGTGFPYDTMLQSFNGLKNSGELAAEMVSAYGAFYNYRGKKVTLSAVRMSALDEFMTAFNAWTDALLASDKKQQIKRAVYFAPGYGDKDNKDLSDFARLAAESDPQGPVAAAGRAMRGVLENKLIVKNVAFKEGSSDSDETSRGLAIYLPFKGYNVKYDQLALAGGTRWDEFLKEMKDVKGTGLESLDACTDGPCLQHYEYLICLINSQNSLQ